MPTALNDLLKATSRSFYLTLRVLPARVRPQIGLAYLLARTTDTIADTEILPVEQRLAALRQLRERILWQSSARLNFGILAQSQGKPEEKLLLEKIEDALAALKGFPEADQKLIRDVLNIITSGQELDLRRFGRAGTPLPAAERRAEDCAPYLKIVALKTESELDDYTFRVAGCVGEFWTKMCRAHLFPNAPIDDAKFLADGVLFGKGLQLVNILRDLPVDLKNGRCYLPSEKLKEINLSPEDLLQPSNENKLRPLYDYYLDLAESNLAAGWNYTNTIPFSQFRVRLACAWPILIGTKTISRLRSGGILDAQRRIKITRSEVRRIILHSLLASPFPGAWQKLFVISGKAVASEAKLT